MIQPVFYKNLESLRGIAALMVALCHCLLVLTVDGNQNIWFATFNELAGVQSAITRFLLIFFNGGAAVVMFFVLSGYVLGLSLDKHGLSISSTFSFYLKRIFRLYPAHIVILSAIAASMLLFHVYQVFEAGSSWYAEWYRHSIDTKSVISNLMLKDIYLNHIAWSLQVELAGSLFLPIAYIVARRVGFWLNLLVLGALVLVSYQQTHLLLIFLYCFYAGLILPQIFGRMKNLVSGGSGIAVLALGIGLSCLGYTMAGPQSLFGRVLIENTGRVLIIGYLLNSDNSASWINRFLAWDVINHLGRYSYSFYLLHFIILYWTAYVLFQTVSPQLLSAVPLFWGMAMALFTVPLTFWLSGKTYQYVEVPMVKVGKKLVRD